MNSTEVPQRPTRVRYSILAMLCVLAMITYLDRAMYGSIKGDMLKSVGREETDFFYILMFFQLAYALFEIPTGWMGDTFGPRQTLIRIVVWWSGCLSLTACAGLLIPGFEVPLITFWVLVGIQFLFGVGEAGAFPNISRSLYNWMPNSERGFAQGAIWLSARFMGGLTPFVVVCLMSGLGCDWRQTLWIFSGVAMIWVAVFYYWFRNRPEEHPATNLAEQELIKEGKAPPTGHAGVPWGRIFGNKNVWALCLMYMVTNFNWYFIMYNLPGALKSQFTELQGTFFGQLQLAILGGAPLLVGMFGCLAGGMLTDALIKKTGNRKWGRRTFAMIGYGMAGVFYLLATQFIGQLWPFAICLILVGLFNDLIMAPSWAAAQDIGRRYSAIVSGSMNMIGNLGATLGIYMTGKFIKAYTVDGKLDEQGCFSILFTIYAAVYMLGVVAWLFIDASKPIPLDDEHE